LNSEPAAQPDGIALKAHNPNPNPGDRTGKLGECDRDAGTEHTAMSVVVGGLHADEAAAEAMSLLRELTKMLAGHVVALESALLPALSGSEVATVPDVIVDGLRSVESALAAALTLESGSAAFTAATTALNDTLQRQVGLERALLLPLLKASFGEGELELLGASMALEAEKYGGRDATERLFAPRH
jgi:hypothetical protein